LNVTFPVGDVPVTLARSVTDCPGAAELSVTVRTVALRFVPTLCEMLPVLPELLALPPYVATIVCGEPEELNADVDTEALPLESPELPSGFPSAVNATVPVGCVPPLVTFAVKVTLEPNDDGFELELTVVVDVACATVKLAVPVEP
jgi:hypothetical protein